MSTIPATRWATGIAEVTAANGRTITVKCPHCKGTHQHGRGVLGSHSVVAGCHAGWSRCREYRIVDLGTRAARPPRTVRAPRRAAA